MRTLLALLFTVVAVVALLLSMRGARPAPPTAAVPAPSISDDSAAPATWPCSDFSRAVAVSGMPVEWSYRLCGRGEQERSIEIRFRNAGRAADSLEYRAWLVPPTDCDGAVWFGPRRIVLPGEDRTASDAMTVPFADYHGELWVCARPAAASTHAWTPQRARHGDVL